MNPGRAPTPIGDDGILPFVTLPHWFSLTVRRELRSRRIEYRVCAGRIRIRPVGSDDPDEHFDQLEFPAGDPQVIQALIDALIPDEFRQGD